MLELTVEKTQTLKEFTDNNYAQASFCFRALLKDKEIKVNGKKTGENTLLQTGDQVQYYLSPKQAEKSAFQVLYQDDNVLVADKESGVNSEAVYAALVREYGNRCRFIHRLDRNTQGLLVFALNAAAETQLLFAFRERQVEKIYHALCVGKFQEKNGVLTAYLKKDTEKSKVKVYDTPFAGTEKIVTEYQVLEELNGLTKVQIVLHTGKTHQIRAHTAHIGNPVLGDMKYGDERVNAKYNATRQCLVAKRLQINTSGILEYLRNKAFVSKFELEI